MLDLLQPVEDERRPGIPVEAEPPQFRQHPGIGRVTAVDRQLDRLACLITAGELLDPPDLARGPGDVPRRHAQVRDPLGDLRRRRQTQRGAHGQVQAGGDAPSQRDARDGVDRKRVPAADPGQHREGEQQRHQPVHRAAQVGKRGSRHGDRDRELGDRITSVNPGQRVGGRPPGRRSEDDAEERAHSPGQHRGHRHPPDRGQPRDQQSDDGEQHNDPGRASQKTEVTSQLMAAGGGCTARTMLSSAAELACMTGMDTSTTTTASASRNASDARRLVVPRPVVPARLTAVAAAADGAFPERPR